MVATQRRMTVEEFERMPEDGNRYELVHGELRQVPTGGVRHGGLEMRLGGRLGGFVEKHGLGLVCGPTTSYRLFPDLALVYSPDVSFISAARLAAIDDLDKIGRFAPDLAVEIVSPTDRMRNVQSKVKDYLDAGVRLVWVVHPRRKTVTVYRPGEEVVVLGVNDVLDGGDVLPGFQLAVAEIFAVV